MIFVLNVVAFLLMGMQVRLILGNMPPDRLGDALALAGMVVVVVIVARLAVVIGFNRLNAWRSRRRGDPEPATNQQAVLVGWCGMRGLVTLAAAFAFLVLQEDIDLRKLALQHDDDQRIEES